MVSSARGPGFESQWCQKGHPSNIASVPKRNSPEPYRQYSSRATSQLPTSPHFSDFSGQFLLFFHLLSFFHFDVLVSWHWNVNDDALLLLVDHNGVWPFSLEESVDIDVEIPQYFHLIVFQSHFLADACTVHGCVCPLHNSQCTA